MIHAIIMQPIGFGNFLCHFGRIASMRGGESCLRRQKNAARHKRFIPLLRIEYKLGKSFIKNILFIFHLGAKAPFKCALNSKNRMSSLAKYLILMK